MMKKTYLIYLLSTAFAFGGCSESFLDQELPLNMEENDIYSSPEHIESTVRGLYAALKNSSSNSFLGGLSYLVFDNRGDDIVNVSSNLNTLYATYTMQVNSTSTENSTTWSNAYGAINKANIFLEKIEGAKELIPDEYERYRQEALFVRALAYFYLNNLYSQPYLLDENAKSVPLRLMAEQSAENNGMPRSTVKQVYEQILTDLTDISALPDADLSEEGTTRATKGAANMLKMRVYMAMGNWNKAIEVGNEVKGYSLVNDFSSLFKAPYYTSETIFSFPMQTNNTPNTQQSLAEFYGDSQIILIDVENGIMSKNGYSEDSDQRLSFKNSDNTLTKFTGMRTKLDWVPIFRYAETLLNLAECYANLEGSSNQEQAKSYLKQVRHRSLDEASDPLNIDGMTDDALKEAIKNERRLEFIGEGIRGLDIIRRGESFVQGTRTTTPSDNGYIWPIPQSEQLINTELNK